MYRPQVKSFCAETTAHGVGNVVKEDIFLWTKIIWLVIVLIVLGGVLFHLTNVVLVYLAYPSQENSQLLAEDPKFPYVTICNAFPLSTNHSDTLAQDPSSEYAQYLELMAGMEDDLLQYELDTGTAMDDILLSPGGIFANLDHSVIQELGHSLKDFVLSCSYLDEACDMDNDWEHSLQADFFNCYTYKGGASSGKTASGPNNGLSLILYMENQFDGLDTINYTYNIYSSIQNSFGIRLDIHDAKTMPTPSDTGVDIMPGHSTSIALKETKIKKLPKPWGDCTDQKNLKNLKKYKYSTTACFIACLTEYVYNRCGCLNYYSQPPDGLPDDYRLCLYIDNTTVTLDDLNTNFLCVSEAHHHFVTSRSTRNKCNCNEPCLYRTYDRSISENIWPASLYHLDAYLEFVTSQPNAEELLAYYEMVDTYEDAYQGNTDGSRFKELMYTNFARINIYFESQTVLERKQTASMTLADLFANVGGTMGLWAGLSVVTVIELISLVVSISGILIQKCRDRKKGKVEGTECSAAAL